CLRFRIEFFLYFFFFFSSRRRHTRWPRDWSSDVCSSDLWLGKKLGMSSTKIRMYFIYLSFFTFGSPIIIYFILAFLLEHKAFFRSEERRVGKECRFWLWLEYEKKNESDRYYR